MIVKITTKQEYMHDITKSLEYAKMQKWKNPFRHLEIDTTMTVSPSI